MQLVIIGYLLLHCPISMGLWSFFIFSLSRILWVMPKIVVVQKYLIEFSSFPPHPLPSSVHVGTCQHFLLLRFYCISFMGLGDCCIRWRLLTMGYAIWFYVELKAFEVSMDEGGSFLRLERRQGLARVVLLGKWSVA